MNELTIKVGKTKELLHVPVPFRLGPVGDAQRLARLHCNAPRRDNESYKAHLLYVELALVEATKQPVLQDDFKNLTHMRHMVSFAIGIDENFVEVCNAKYI